MAKFVKRIACIILAFSVLLSVPLKLGAAESKTIRVGIISDGKYGVNTSYKEYGTAYLNQVAKLTGYGYRYLELGYKEALHMLDNGAIDVIYMMEKTPDLVSRYSFSKEHMGVINYYLYAKADNTDIYYQDYDRFEGSNIGVTIRGNAKTILQDYATAHGFEWNIVEYDNVSELLDALNSGEVALISTPELSGVQGLKQVDTFDEKPVYFMMSSSNDSLREQFDTAIDNIKTETPYLEEILKNQYFSNEDTINISLTREEQQYVENCDPIRVLCVEKFNPLAYYDKKTNSVDGAFVQIALEIAEKTGLQFEFSTLTDIKNSASLIGNGEADMVVGAVMCRELMANQYVRLSDMFTQADTFAVTRTGESFVDMTNPVIALPTVYQDSVSIFKHSITEGHIVYYSTPEECFAAVADGTADVTVQNQYLVEYYLKEKEFGNLSISSASCGKEYNCFLVSGLLDPRAISILNKGIAAIGSDRVDQILANYLADNTETTVAEVFFENKSSIIFTIGIFVAMMALVFWLSLIYIGNRKNYEAISKSRKYAETDGLTGILSGEAFYEKVENILASDDDKELYILLFIDIDKFKMVNELLGYDEGNRILRFIGMRLGEWGEATDTMVARLDADHFAGFTKKNAKFIAAFVQHLKEECESRFPEISIKFSCGIYNVRKNDVKAALMCDRAKLAATDIKGNHLKQVNTYDDTHRMYLIHEQNTINDMEDALEKREFRAYFQPKYSLDTKEIVGAEALVRWIHHEHGYITPDKFIPIFERNGFIGRLDIYMFEEVCRHISSWREKDKRLVPISVNLSRVGFYNPKLCDTLVEILDRYNVPIELIELEITESAYTINEDVMSGLLQTLKDKGFRILMDDFGSGYSSLNMLKEVPIDEIKLDLRFLGSNDPYSRSEIILSEIIRMINKMKLDVIAEGVETKEQVDKLLEYGCTKAQGFYFSRPIPDEDFSELI